LSEVIYIIKGQVSGILCIHPIITGGETSHLIGNNNKRGEKVHQKMGNLNPLTKTLVSSMILKIIASIVLNPTKN
jgi:hypothetical protein